MRGPLLFLATSFAASVVAAPVPLSTDSPVEIPEPLMARGASEAALSPVLDTVKRTLLERLDAPIETKRIAAIEDPVDSEIERELGEQDSPHMKEKRDSKGDYISSNHDKRDSKGDYISSNHDKRDSKGDYISSNHDKRGSKGDYISSNHDKRDSKGDYISSNHDKREPRLRVAKPSQDKREPEDEKHINTEEKREAHDEKLVSA